MTVRAGTVSVEDGNKAAEEFAPARKVRVELNFEIAEGADPELVLEHVGLLADGQVKKMLGRSRATTTATSAKTSAKKADEPKKAEEKPKPIEVVLPPEPKDEPAKADASSMDEFDAPAEEQPPVTDTELRDAARARADKLGNPVPIRKLVATFAPKDAAGFQLIQIPQERRREFLAKLGSLAA